MTVHIESIPMQKHLMRAAMFASSAIQLDLAISRMGRRRINTIIPVATSEKLITLAESLQFTIENRLPFKTESPDTISVLYTALEMLIQYDRMDLAANAADMDRINFELLDLRINDCMLLKRNLQSVLQPA